MPKVSDLLAAKAKATIQVGETSFEIVFYVMWRERFTPDEQSSYVGMALRDYMKIWLPRVLVSWDFVDDDGHAVPVTADAIEQHAIPNTLLLACHDRIINSDLSGKVTLSNSPVT